MKYARRTTAHPIALRPLAGAEGSSDESTPSPAPTPTSVQMFGETDELVATKTKIAVDAGLSVMACVGENRASGNTATVKPFSKYGGPDPYMNHFILI